jgi:hypothetical protein
MRFTGITLRRSQKTSIRKFTEGAELRFRMDRADYAVDRNP